MAVGAVGIVIGLALYGPKLIKTVGSEITELDQMRAFSIAMAAAITVIIASQLGLPVSSTHIAIGGIFGVGFLREYLQDHKEVIKLDEEEKKLEKDENKLEQYLDNLQELLDLDEDKKDKKIFKQIANLYGMVENEEKILAKRQRMADKLQRKKYVKRDAFKKIIAAWIITVPVSAILSASIYFMVRGMMI